MSATYTKATRDGRDVLLKAVDGVVVKVIEFVDDEPVTKRPPEKRTHAEKMQAVQMVERMTIRQGMSIAEACRDTGIAISQYYLWRKYDSDTVPAEPENYVQKMKRETAEFLRENPDVAEMVNEVPAENVTRCNACGQEIK